MPTALQRPGRGQGRVIAGVCAAIADRAQARLHRRYWRLVTHGKAHNKAVTAVARELSGFIWAALREHQPAKKSGASVG